jgi:hypothetical protein
MIFAASVTLIVMFFPLEVALLRSAAEPVSAAHTSASLWYARDEFAF